MQGKSNTYLSTQPVWLFTVKDKGDGKRYLMKLTGEPKDREEFHRVLKGVNSDFDARTIRWLDSYHEATNFKGVHCGRVYDSNDNAFVEEEP